MTYHCIYKDECNKDCKYKDIKNPIIKVLGLIFDMRTKELSCAAGRRVILTSKERIVCSNNLKCDRSDCVLIQNYITKENVSKFLWGKEPIYNITCLIDGSTMIINTSTNCLSIWN